MRAIMNRTRVEFAVVLVMGAASMAAADFPTFPVKRLLTNAEWQVYEQRWPVTLGRLSLRPLGGRCRGTLW